MTDPTKPADLTEAVLAGSTTVLRGDLAELPQPVTIIETGIENLAYVAAAIPGDGLRVQPLDWSEAENERIGPAYASGTRRVVDARSFLAEIARRPLQPNTSALWADRVGLKITAVYDDHPGGRDLENPRVHYEPRGRAGRRADRLELGLRMDQDWEAWHALSGTEHTQVEFGDKIEDLLHTVQEPDQASLLNTINHIRVTSDNLFDSKINRQDGAINLTHREDTSATAPQGSLAIPEMIRIRSRVFDGYPVEFEYDGWFRYRVKNSHLFLQVKLRPTRRVFLAAWEAVVQEIHAGINPGGEVFPILTTDRQP